ncbi:MAG: protease inhibitor I9 family protein, partial [Chloroflexota bacterium]
MSRRTILTAILALALAAPVAPAAAGAGHEALDGIPSQAARAVAGDYVVVLRAGTTTRTPTGIGVVRRGRADRKALTTRVIDRASTDGDRALRVRHRYSATMAGFSATLSATEVEALRADPDVLSVVPDVVVRADGVLRGSAPSGATFEAPDIVPPGVTRIGGRGAADGVEVAILDTGIGSTADATMGGELNVVGGTDCVSGDGITSTADPNFHGTHVAGTVGAAANQSGVVGVAPGIRLL